MKLTNFQRDAFVNAAMLDVPQVDYSEQIRKVLIDDAALRLPPKVRALWNDKELRGFVKVDRKYVSSLREYFAVPVFDGEFSPAALAAAAELSKQDTAQSVKRGDLRAKLRAVAYSVTTRDKLIEALPEFKKYVPGTDAVPVSPTQVAVIGVVEAFKAAGFPKGEKPEPAPKKVAAKKLPNPPKTPDQAKPVLKRIPLVKAKLKPAAKKVVA